MSWTDELSDLVRAGVTGIWVRSYEHDDAVTSLTALCNARKWRIASWDVDRGFVGVLSGAATPLVAAHAVRTLSEGVTQGAENETALLVLRNFHRFLGGAEIVQAVDTALEEGRSTRVITVVLSAAATIPLELEKLFVSLDHPLPDRGELERILRGVANEETDWADADDVARAVGAAGGLTRLQAERAVALSLVKHQSVRVDDMWGFKADAVKREGLMEIHRGVDRFANIGGLQALKDFCLEVVRPSGPLSGGARARGVMLLGPTGTGKSAFAKALGNEVGRPTVLLDVGALMGSLVGQTEERTRRALKTIDAMAPCVVMVDEVEKAFAGVGGGAGDSGVSARMFGTFLTYLNDHETDVFFVVSANDVSRMPPEFLRAERFDATFFLDWPGPEQRAVIWDMYEKLFGVGGPRPKDADWTGSEIRACCRLAAIRGGTLLAASQYVVPAAITSREKIRALREWAEGRCVSADTGTVYAREASGGKRRGVKDGDATGRLRVERGPGYEAS